MILGPGRPQRCPRAVPGLVAALGWRWLLDEQSGVVNAWLLGLGLTSEPVDWLSDPRIGILSELDGMAKVSRISVTDSGPGVPPALRERVFQPFFTMKRNGTGLGLALVQKIIVFHNGRIAVGVAPQGGASFHVTLPLGHRS